MLRPFFLVKETAEGINYIIREIDITVSLMISFEFPGPEINKTHCIIIIKRL